MLHKILQSKGIKILQVKPFITHSERYSISSKENAIFIAAILLNYITCPRTYQEEAQNLARCNLI